jgi:hypothetical protein
MNHTVYQGQQLTSGYFWGSLLMGHDQQRLSKTRRVGEYLWKAAGKAGKVEKTRLELDIQYVLGIMTLNSSNSSLKTKNTQKLWTTFKKQTTIMESGEEKSKTSFFITVFQGKKSEKSVFYFWLVLTSLD